MMKRVSRKRELRNVLVSLVVVMVFAVFATPAKAAGWDYDLFVYLDSSGLTWNLVLLGQVMVSARWGIGYSFH